MTPASKTTLNLNNLKILRPQVRKNITNFQKLFCIFPSCHGLFYTLNLFLPSTYITPGADAINISGLLNPKKLGNFKNRMLLYKEKLVV